MKHKIKSARAMLCRLLVGTLACTTIFGGTLAQTYGATDVAASLSQRYVVEEAKQMSGVKVLFKNKDMTDTFTNPVINVNDRVYLPIRDISNLLQAEIKWEQDTRVATISYNGKVIEVPIGSDKIVVDGNPVPIDNNGTKALLYHSYTYLPLRVILEYCGFPVDYQVVGDIKYVLIDSQVPNPDLHTYDNEIEVPEQYKDTTFLEVYNYLRRTTGLTEKQAKEVMAGIKSFAPLSNENHQRQKYESECMGSSDYIEIGSATPDISIKGEYRNQWHPTQKGWCWNGNNWECGFSLYFGF